MEILMTGKLASITEEVAQQLLMNHKVAFASSDLVPEHLGKRATPFQISPHDPDFEKIFSSYHFDAVIYFAQPLYAEQEYYDEYQDLECCLRLCAKHDISRFLYLQPKYHVDFHERLPDNDLGVLFSACDLLCDYYRKRCAMKLLTCRIPCLYGYGETTSVLGDAVHQAQNKASVLFCGAKDQYCGLLSQKDLGELLLRILENWVEGYEQIDIPAGDVLTFGELGAAIKTFYPTVRLSYSQNLHTMDVSFSADAVKQEYDWIPLINPVDDLEQIISELSDVQEEENTSVMTRIKAFIKKHSFVIKMIELVLGFILMELLNRVTGTTIQFRYIDFRLLYIVLLGTIHGMKTGLVAAAFASVSLLAAMIGGHSNWNAVIYDIDTWLPYVFYFLLGAVTGYVKDRLRSENEFLTEEKAKLEEKYILLNEFYVSALQNKDKYKMQIMSYRDSFGRLFDITKSLDSTMVDEVFNQALYALEGILDNHSVCIYRIDKEMRFGRLIVCSKEIVNVADKSINLSSLERMLDKFETEELWVNRDRLLGYPEYAVPIYHDGRPLALIALQKASYEQMAVYYENLVKIICGLIKISLVHALEYSELIEDDIYLPGSRIVNNEYFGKMVQIKEEMAQNGVSEYVLIHFATTPQNRIDVANKITSLIRTTDVLGLGRDGELYLCLNQTNESNLHIVLNRLQASGLNFHEIDAERQG